MTDLTIHFVSSQKSNSELSKLLENSKEDNIKSLEQLEKKRDSKLGKGISENNNRPLENGENNEKKGEKQIYDIKVLSGKSFHDSWNAPWNADQIKNTSKSINQSKNQNNKNITPINFDTKNNLNENNTKSVKRFTNENERNKLPVSVTNENVKKNESFRFEESFDLDEMDDDEEYDEGMELDSNINHVSSNDEYENHDTQIVSTQDEKLDKKKRKRRMATISDYIRKEDVELNKLNEKMIYEMTTNDIKVKKQHEIFSNVRFQDLEGKLNKGLYKNLTQFLKLEKLTFIQERSFLPVVENKDVLIKSETGSGKTMAYLLPIIQSLSELSAQKQIKREQGTFAFVIAPTRELCIQIQRVAESLTTCFPWMVTSTIIGGDNPQKEKKRLKKGITILIATPGRLEDHLKNTKSFIYDNLRHIVLDEADRLLDLGFESTLKTVYHILGQKNIITQDKKPQTVLVSATLTNKIRQLASWTLKNEVYAGFTQQEITDRTENISSNEFTVPDQLYQHFMIVPCKLRLPALVSFLTEKSSEAARKISGQEKASKIIVFFSSCSSVDFHYQLLINAHTKRQIVGEDGTIAIKKKKILPNKFFKLHGDMPQTKRTEVYFEFLKAEEGILLCTDVAARGLDMPKTDWILQYDSPGDPKEYLHRVGRTARLGFQGSSCLFLMPHEASYIKLLRKYGISIKKINTEIVLENLAFLTDRKSNDVFEMCASIQIQLESIIKENDKLHVGGAQAFQDFVKSYATHGKLTKFIFHPKSLHLGHLATAFGLKETPSEIKKLTFSGNKKEQKEHEVENELAKRGFDVEVNKKKRSTLKNNRDRDESQHDFESEKKQKSLKLSVRDRIKIYKEYQSNPTESKIRPKIDVKSIIEGKNLPTNQSKKNAESFNVLLESNKRKREGTDGEREKKRTKFTFTK